MPYALLFRPFVFRLADGQQQEHPQLFKGPKDLADRLTLMDQEATRSSADATATASGSTEADSQYYQIRIAQQLKHDTSTPRKPKEELVKPVMKAAKAALAAMASAFSASRFEARFQQAITNLLAHRGSLMAAVDPQVELADLDLRGMHRLVIAARELNELADAKFMSIMAKNVVHERWPDEVAQVEVRLPDNRLVDNFRKNISDQMKIEFRSRFNQELEPENANRLLQNCESSGALKVSVDNEVLKLGYAHASCFDNGMNEYRFQLRGPAPMPVRSAGPESMKKFFVRTSKARLSSAVLDLGAKAAMSARSAEDTERQR